jgi:hypothetical protein
LKHSSPFFRDTALTLNSRTYWLGEDVFGTSEPKALTTGGYSLVISRTSSSSTPCCDRPSSRLPAELSGPLVGFRAEVEYVDEHYDETDLPNNDLRQVRAIAN